MEIDTMADVLTSGATDAFTKDERVVMVYYGYNDRQWMLLPQKSRVNLVKDHADRIRHEIAEENEKGGKVILIPGVGPDAPIVINEHGASQSASPYRCDLLPPLAILKIAEVLKHGAEKYAPNQWRKISSADHLNHVLVHLLAHMAGDTSDDHTGHALCRMAMFYEAVEAEKKVQSVNKGVMPP